MPDLLSLADVSPEGELRRRMLLNFSRLHDDPFHFDAMVNSSTSREAPGDWIGRAILGLTLLGQTLGRDPDHLEPMIARLPEVLNERGYIGAIHAAGTADENQVGGHNGLLRGLCEYYLWKRDPRALAVIRSVVSNLMVPTRSLYAAYPGEPLEKLGAGKAIGLTVKNEGAWIGLSTDIGTVFFTLDGLTQAYTIEPLPGLRELIETMIARYAQIDVVHIGAQTHSTLSTLRGIMRWWKEVNPDPRLLNLVRSRYQLYRTRAETEHYANYNWFGRPEWTEACGVVDSFLLAVQLWSATTDSEYLRTAHCIYFNALSYAQRPNGGFGCDLCVGADGRLDLAPHPKIFEAPWCCSMRGAEGLARAAQMNLMVENSRRAVWQVFNFDGDYTLRLPGGSVSLRIQSEYPSGGHVKWTVLRSESQSPVEWRFLVPPGVAAGSMVLTDSGRSVELNEIDGFMCTGLSLADGDVLSLRFDLDISVLQPATNSMAKGHYRFAHGPLLLGAEGSGTLALRALEDFESLGEGRYRSRTTGSVIGPIGGLTFKSEAEARAHKVQMLFQVPEPLGKPDHGRIDG